MEHLEMMDFLWVAIALFSGLMLTRLFKYCHLNLPDVTAYTAQSN